MKTLPQKSIWLFSIALLSLNIVKGQDLSEGLIANDMNNHPMQDIAKPAYLQTITDPAFGTTIRRITDAGAGNIIKPLYSTIQAWNSDESYMVVLDVTNNVHQLLDGMNYTFIRNLDDIAPDDEEQIFWSHTDPDIFFYVDRNTNELIRYHVSTQTKEVIVNLLDAAGNGDMVALGNDVQMQSWDDDVFGFRTSSSGNNDNVYYYRISTNTVTPINVSGSESIWTAPMPGPSGDTFFLEQHSYDSNGNLIGALQLEPSHNCIGKLANGHDAIFTVNFDTAPVGNLVAYDLTDPSVYFPIISQSSGYPYPKTGTHISSLAYNNTNGSWVAASMIGYDEDGQSLLDQEIIIAKADPNQPDVYRIAHHRADENEFDYYGEPHVSISPSGTRVIFGSDWSGSDDGHSVDCYVVELPAFQNALSVAKNNSFNASFYPNPLVDRSTLRFNNPNNNTFTFCLYNALGQLVYTKNNINTNEMVIKKNHLQSGIYLYTLSADDGSMAISDKIIVN